MSRNLAVGISLGVVAVAYQWFNISHLKQLGILEIPPVFDAALYLYQSVEGYHVLVKEGFSGFLKFAAASSSIRAPWFEHMAVVTYLFFGEPSREAALWSHLPYLFVLLLTVYALGRKAFESQIAGVSAALVLLSFPVVISYSRFFQTEIPLVTFVGLTLLLVIKSWYFESVPWSAALGVALGLCLLTRTMAPAYYIGPLGMGLYLGLSQSAHKRRVLGNLFLALGIGCVLASLWWLPNLGPALDYLLGYGYGGRTWLYVTLGQIEPGFAEHVVQVLKGVFLTGLSPAFLCLSLFLCVVTLVLKRQSFVEDPEAKQVRYLILAWLVIPLLFLISTRDWHIEFTVGLMPPMALLIGGCLARLRRLSRVVFAACTLLVLAAAGVNVSQLMFGQELLESKSRWIVGSDSAAVSHMLAAYPNGDVHRDRNWHLQDLASAVLGASAVESPRLMFLVEELYFSPCSMLYLRAENQYPIEIVSNHPPSKEWLQENLSRVHFVVSYGDKSSYERRFTQHLAVEPAVLREQMKSSGAQFVDVGSWELPNGMRVILFQNLSVIPERIAPESMSERRSFGLFRLGTPFRDTIRESAASDSKMLSRSA
ncbi:MAG: glycosyltransferase family 39 protein [Candidatus Omnitrophica bacterium]|nr:glycosyltransferase family 39 protein [Candidatus Omnitrophota bacterium]